MPLDGGNLRLRRVDRRENDERQPELFAGRCERASVVARRRGDDARRRLAAFEARDDGVEGAAGLERVGKLLRFELQTNARAGEIRQPRRFDEGRPTEVGRNPSSRGEDVSEVHARGCPRCAA